MPNFLLLMLVRHHQAPGSELVWALLPGPRWWLRHGVPGHLGAPALAPVLPHCGVQRHLVPRPHPRLPRLLLQLAQDHLCLLLQFQEILLCNLRFSQGLKNSGVCGLDFLKLKSVFDPWINEMFPLLTIISFLACVCNCFIMSWYFARLSRKPLIKTCSSLSLRVSPAVSAEVTECLFVVNFLKYFFMNIHKQF